ncbi:MAG: Gfo/Idh/MocA family oxidoreductase [Verrucomicrobiales bacterium]|nr:Gfo/Idh/MocA family oxidoreductase [Verrucomicrobiales bacterium]
MNRFILTLLLLLAPVISRSEEIRIGIIGLDTSHVIAFTKQYNDKTHPKHVPGGKVVAAFQGGSPDIPSSVDRIEGFTETLVDDFGVQIYDTIEELCENVDAILLESVDGRPHLDQVKPVLAAGLPVFIDKPVAGSLRDAIEIYRLSEETGTPCWSASSLRFRPGVVAVAEADAGEVKGAISYGPATIEKTHPDLFWYGIHPTEALFTVLGDGCKTVTRVHTKDTDVVTGTWEDGKVGVLYGQRNQKTGFKVIKFGTKQIVEQKEGGDYTEMLQEIIQFFRTGKPPVSPESTLEIYAFMEAADESKRRGGTPVSIEEVMKKASAGGE